MTEKMFQISLRDLTEAAGLLISAAFVVSIFYDWGFFTSLGLNSRVVPMSMTDHIATAVLWFPKLLTYTFLFLSMEFFIRRIEGGLTEEEIIQGSRNPTLIKRFRNSPKKPFIIIIIFGFFVWIMIGAYISSLTLGILWILAAETMFSAPLLAQRTTRALRIFLTFLPFVGIVAFFSGYNEGLHSRYKAEPSITIVGTDASREFSGVLLRVLEGGILMMQNARIIYVVWSQVKEIHIENLEPHFHGILCLWFIDCTKYKQENP